MPGSPNRQPWPMKWIALAILLFIVPYTILTLRYRKPGEPFRPYEDTKNRANVSRLLAAGYQRVPLAAQRPVEIVRPGTAVSTSAIAGGLPDEIRSALVETPLLPAEILKVAAPPSVGDREPYPILFTCALPTDKQQLGGADLYMKADDLVIVPTFERLAGQLLTRHRENLVLITVPAGSLRRGDYRVTLVGERASRAWSLQVK